MSALEATLLQHEQHKQDRTISIRHFSVAALDEKVALVHYISQDMQTNQRALRTSVWKAENGAWKLAFHQGTPCG